MGTSLRVERTHVGGAGQRKAGNDAVNDLQYRREQLRMGGEQDAQRNRKRQHPLAHRHPRDHVIDQVRGALRHAPRPARGAKPAPLAGEAVREDAAFEKGVKLVCQHRLSHAYRERRRHTGTALDRTAGGSFIGRLVNLRAGRANSVRGCRRGGRPPRSSDRKAGRPELTRYLPVPTTDGNRCLRRFPAAG